LFEPGTSFYTRSDTSFTLALENEARLTGLGPNCGNCFGATESAQNTAHISTRIAVPDHSVPYGTVLSRDAFPGTSCQTTIGCPYGTRVETFRNSIQIKPLRMSRRDGAIVAWHEVPLARSAWEGAPPQKDRPVGYGLIRAVHAARLSWCLSTRFEFGSHVRRSAH
jgi:hypothetical protein